MQQQDFAIHSQTGFSSGNKISSTFLSHQDPNKVGENTSSNFELKRLYDEEYLEKVRIECAKLMEQNYQAAGAGSFESLYPKIFTRFDRFHKRYYTPNTVYSGYTFITRPRLSLTATNLQADRYLQLFNTTNNQTIQFAIRCLLDTVFSNIGSGNISKDKLLECPFFDPYNPFIPILTNTVQDISGFPSQDIATFTTEGGFFSEDQRFAMGSDRNNKSFDLNLSFTDVEGGLVMALFKLWLTYIDLVTTGEVLAYTDDIVHRRLNYTVSIYRFLVDPTNRYIVNAAKCTGCFPTNRPVGAIYDVSRAERYVEAAKNFTIQFSCNKFEENDPIILLEFNTLMNRYCPGIGLTANSNGKAVERYVEVPYELDYNYVGLPYITIKEGSRPRLDFRYQPSHRNSSSLQNNLNTFNSSMTSLNQKTFPTNDSLTQPNTVNLGGAATYTDSKGNVWVG